MEKLYRVLSKDERNRFVMHDESQNAADPEEPKVSIARVINKAKGFINCIPRLCSHFPGDRYSYRYPLRTASSDTLSTHPSNRAGCMHDRFGLPNA